MNRQNDIDDILFRLNKSTFRNSFKLKDKDFNYIKEKGMDKIKEHTFDFINKRLDDENTFTDGKQTPTKGHPTFIAQHATATCCRGCIEKWHHIPKGRKLNDNEKEYLSQVILTWINNQNIIEKF